MVRRRHRHRPRSSNHSTETNHSTAFNAAATFLNFDLRSLLLPSRKKKEGKHTTRDDNDNDQVMAVQLLIPTATAQTRTK
jgi:hypothetical protein